MNNNTIRHWMQLCEASEALPPDVIQAFTELGDLQRGDPEAAMLRVQHLMGGGVLNPVVEHVGDITHRMSHRAQYHAAMGFEKVQKTLKWLKHDYGFEREMQENIQSNARYRKVDPEKLKIQITAALRSYAAEHSKLPVYNKAQWLARQAAVFVGLERFKDARVCLQMLLNMCPDEATYKAKAFEFSRDPDGKLRHFRPGSA